MHDEEPIYDVAISFLYQDVALAQRLYDQLSKSLTVFFFPRNQDELAGTDGLESMRRPFRSQSRLNVVLYRPNWGETPWTGVEEIAVKESCLETSFRSIFFFIIEPTRDLPGWLPDTHVRFNYADFTIEEAVGAIKLRVQQRGGHFAPMTPAKKADLLQTEETYQRDRRQMSSQEGLQKIYENVESLFDKITSQIAALNAKGYLAIESQTKLSPREMEQACLLGMHRLGLAVIWFHRFANTLGDAVLIIRECDQNLIVPPGHVRFDKPNIIREEKYDPDISRSREYIWIPRKDKERQITTTNLATNVVLQFLDFVERDRA